MLTHENKKFSDRMFVVQYGGRIKPEKYYCCVVWDSWRLVENKALFDLSNDPAQNVNVAGKYPEILHKMQTYYENWWKTVAPGVEEVIPLFVGSDKENPIVLTSNNWIGVDVDNRTVVANAAGTPRGGAINIDVQEEGKYRIKLSRWPFHLNWKLNIAGPEKNYAGNLLPVGKALPIEFGCFSLNNSAPLIVKSSPDATNLSFEVNLLKGRNSIQSWFRDEKGKDLCGAYYVSLQRL
jgi:arylsulfatase